MTISSRITVTKERAEEWRLLARLVRKKGQMATAVQFERLARRKWVYREVADAMTREIKNVLGLTPIVLPDNDIEVSPTALEG